MNELITSFSRLSSVDLVDKARHIVASLSSEPAISYYPTPLPGTAAIAAAADELADALAQTTSVPVTQLRNSLRGPLIELLQLQASNLETTTPGDRTKLSYTGYDLRKIPEHSHQVPEAPLNVHVTATGQNGGIKIKCSPVTHADFYEFETTADPVNGPWAHYTSTTNSQNMEVEGLQRGKDVYVRVRGINPNGPGPWSELGDTMVT